MPPRSRTASSPTTPIVDLPVTIDGWSPHNFSRSYAGTVTVRDAFARSINTVAVKLAERVGFDTVAETARRFGITTPIDPRPAMSLGASDVTLIELTAAYAAVANQGVEARPYAITKIATAAGRVLYTREPPEARVVVAPYVAAKLTDLMQAAVVSGSGRAAQIGRPLAGKTGTTSSNRDGWFVGFTSGMTAGVWMGRDDAKPVPVLQGGRAPARAFAAYMARAVGGTPPAPLTTDVAAPDLGLEPDDQVYGIAPDAAAPGVPAKASPAKSTSTGRARARRATPTRIRARRCRATRATITPTSARRRGSTTAGSTAHSTARRADAGLQRGQPTGPAAVLHRC